MHLNPSAYALIGLTAMVAALIGILVFAVLKFAAAARESRLHLRENKSESAFVTAALHEALTKLKAQEREMSARAEASERLSSEIVESLSSGLLVVSSDGQLRILNPAGRRLLHRDDAAITQPYREVLPESLAQLVHECLNKGEPIVRQTLQISSIDQSPAYLGVSVSPLSNGHGEPHGAICLFTDLTPVVEMEEQLRLKESLAQVGELTAGIAHEFRNGLATIHGYARLLELDKLPADMRPYLRGIRDETDMLGAVVRNFLNFAKPTERVMGTVDVRAVADRAVEEIRTDAVSQGGRALVSGEFATIPGDEVLLKQALSNLCRNALEACTEARVVPRIVVEGTVDRPQSALRVA